MLELITPKLPGVSSVSPAEDPCDRGLFLFNISEILVMFNAVENKFIPLVKNTDDMLILENERLTSKGIPGEQNDEDSQGTWSIVKGFKRP